MLPTDFDKWTHESAYGRSIGPNGDDVVPPYLGVQKSKWRYRSGVNTPNYRTYEEKGMILPDNPYVRRSISEQRQMGYRNAASCYVIDGVPTMYPSGRAEGNLSVWDCDYISASSLPLPTGYAERALQLAKRKLVADILDMKVNLAQAFAERKQTAQLLADSAKKVADAIRYLKKGNLSAAAAAVGAPKPSKRANSRYRSSVVAARKAAKPRAAMDKALSRGVLSIQYGWRPLLNDIYGSYEQLESKAHQEIYFLKKSSSLIGHEIDTKETVGFSKVKTNAWVERKVYLKVMYAVSRQEVRTLAQVGVSNPALVAWELVPWSFIIDWFIPIGNYISSLDATSGLYFVGGSMSTRTYGEMKKHQTWDYWTQGAYQNYSTHYTGEASATYEWSDLDRVPLTAFPTVRFPVFKNPLSMEHALNAISLLSQLRK